jgi:DNA-binding response OmpR family regulator
MADTDKRLQGLRLLVVEDQMLVAAAICDAMEDCGCTVVGPTGWVGKALELVQANQLDGAVLDVNLNGTMSFPVAALLAERGVPFLFLTGYGDGVFPTGLRAAPRMQKPFDLEALMKKMKYIFADHAHRDAAAGDALRNDTP